MKWIVSEGHLVFYFDLFLSSPEPMKLALSIEAKAWKMLLCRYLNEEYKKKMSDMIAFINEYLKKLSRPIRDLDDVRFAMEALSCIRDNEIQMDMTLGPIEVRNVCIFLSWNATFFFNRETLKSWFIYLFYGIIFLFFLSDVDVLRGILIIINSEQYTKENTLIMLSVLV